MDEKVLVALIGLTSALIGGVIVAWANWGIEKRKQKLLYRKELIASWRNMLADAAAYQKNNNATDQDVYVYLERHKDYYSYRPYIKVDAQTALGLMTAKNKADDSSLSPLLHNVMMTITRMEKEWDLV